MITNRRSFLRASSVLACGSLFCPRWVFAAAEASAPVVSFAGGDLRLLEFISTYSSVVRLTGASVLAHLRRDSNCGMRLLVELTDVPKLLAALPRAPFTRLYAKGNAISYLDQGGAYSAENLTPADFAARIASLQSKENVSFAHDALLYDPVSKQLDDPLRSVAAGELRLIRRPKKPADALALAMRGTADARAAAIAEGNDFAHWKAQLVQTVVDKKAAPSVAAAFARGLPAFAAQAGSDEVKSALQTPLISTAIKSTLGLTTKQLIGDFDRLRGTFGQSYSDNAVWVYVLLAKQLKSDTRGWIDGAILEDVHWREAFATAKKIDQALQSPQLGSQS